jgi:4a-hydroxytetrahydrobiopterin dehydratase
MRRVSEELAKRHCQACVPGTPPIEEARAVELEAQLDPAWSREGTTRLRREFRFRNFRDAFGFTARVALLAESEGHHPDLELGWGRVAVTLTTHAAGGLTDNDFILAAKIDRL